MLSTFKRFGRKKLDELNLPAAAKAERLRDRQGLTWQDPGIDAVESESLNWLCAAQDFSATQDGGAARHFSLITGWGASYPETSGYIVPTLIDAGLRRRDPLLVSRAQRMIDWLTTIQFAEGGFQGGTIGASPRQPVTFNTGQILLGLAASARHLDAKYTAPMHGAAQWLVNTIDDDGCWRKFPTPFAAPGEKAYETHVSWGLIEAARSTAPIDAEAAHRYVDVALRNARWAITKQQSNGWFDSCCLQLPNAPLTHTIGYVLRGITEIFLYTREDDLLTSALRTADSLVSCVGPDGFLAGRLDRKWHAQVDWACITGSAQIAHSMLLLFGETGRLRYRDAAYALLSHVRRSIRIDGPPGVRGGVKGSFPVDGDYGTFQYLSWAAKFAIDAGHAEREFRALASSAGKLQPNRLTPHIPLLTHADAARRS